METERKIITVNKTVAEKLPADTIVASLKAKCTAKRHADAFGEADKIADNAIYALKRFGFEGIKTLGVSVSEIREDKKTVGYRATKNLSLELAYDGKRLCELTSALSETPLEWSVSFALKDESHRKKLIERAVKQAMDDAECIAKAANAKLSAFCGAEYSSSEGFSPTLLRAATLSETEPELIELRESVTCKWETAER